MNIDIRVIPDGLSVVLTLIATLILFFGLRKLLYKPVSKMLNDRKERINKDIEGAKSLKEEAMKLREEYEVRISQAKREAQEIIESGRKRGEEIRESIIAEAREEANNILERAKKEINKEMEKALFDIKVQTLEMALLIASSILEENLTLDKHKQLINRFVDEVGTQRWQI
ncbi:MAG TPA: F0F1 ATP synthase subunit B [Tissierellia bacterium]|nr:F0F1 ATP synthase subunit B [Tissierellia bacterium]